VIPSANIIHRDRELAGLVSDHTEHVPGIGMTRLSGQYPAVNLFRQIEPARLVVLKSDLECF
jgi:hypothetical protein